jgi:hypothetical protein
VSDTEQEIRPHGLVALTFWTAYVVLVLSTVIKLIGFLAD